MPSVYLSAQIKNYFFSCSKRRNVSVASGNLLTVGVSQLDCWHIIQSQ